MGLLVIVILVSIILFFFLTFSLNNEENDFVETTEFVEGQTTGSLGSAILETTTSCGYNIRGLVEDCAVEKQITCGEMTSCSYVSQEIDLMLERTLDVWGINYKLDIKKNDQEIIPQLSEGTCGVSLSGQQKEITPIGTRYGTVLLVITRCR